MIYLDASVLVSLLVADAHTDKVLAWQSGLSETVVISDLANLEVSAVLLRDLRTGRLSRRKVESALIDFDAIRAASERLSHGVNDFLIAERLVRNPATRLAAADALHLASAKNVGATMATLDLRLAEAARAQWVETATLG